MTDREEQERVVRLSRMLDAILGDAVPARALAVPVEPNLRLSRRYRAAVAIASNDQ